MIKKIKQGGKDAYKVLSTSGKHLGTYASEDEAKARLQQVEFFKGVAAGKIKVPAKKRGETLKRLVAASKKKG